MTKLTHARLLEVLDYNPLTGIFTWKINTGKKQLVGKQAGTIDPKGYIAISIDGEKIRGHRLAWFYVYGVWPSKNIDHENGRHADNRFKNLRDITQKGNIQNQHKVRSDSKSQIQGVRFRVEKNKYEARIRIDGKQKHVGYFDTAEEAREAYLIKKRQVHPTFSG